LQFSGTLINLAQNGQIFYENQAHKANLPKMGKYFTTIVGQFLSIFTMSRHQQGNKKLTPTIT